METLVRLCMRVARMVRWMKSGATAIKYAAHVMMEVSITPNVMPWDLHW
jgi:hypothetical protein